MRPPVPVREWPLTVRLFVVLVLVWDAAFIALDTSYFDHDLLRRIGWQVFGLASLAAMAGWRQRWAWWIYIIGPIMYWAAPAWGARFHPVWDAAELVVFGLLVSPSMRRHVFIPRTRRRRPGRAWTVCLLLSGALTLVGALGGGHHSPHLADRIVGNVLFWLLLAAAMRLVLAVFQGAARLARRGGEAPPAVGPEA